jgi:acyl-coenzyme A synthetase/AMP-(fatty) acid ligase
LTTKVAEEYLQLENNKLYLITLIVAGEKLSLIKLNKFDFINEYGPTENTVCTTQFRVTECNKNILIGAPIFNTSCYVLDKNLRPLPIGAVGELYIGGVGLARGYLNRPELTAEKFIANPFRSELERVESKNTRLYKTGDLVRWLPDGNLEYIGRNDFQVKIRGYRIELGEIESILSTYAGISQSVVIA